MWVDEHNIVENMNLLFKQKINSTKILYYLVTRGGIESVLCEWIMYFQEVILICVATTFAIRLMLCSEEE